MPKFRAVRDVGEELEVEDALELAKRTENYAPKIHNPTLKALEQLSETGPLIQTSYFGVLRPEADYSMRTHQVWSGSRRWSVP